MHDLKPSLPLIALAALLASSVAAEEPVAAAEAELAEEAADPAAEPEPAAAVATAAEEFRIPPGFRKKRVGKHVVYCRKEQTMGTRLDQEKCYDEQGLRDMEQSRRENQEKVDQMRRICGSQAACGGS